MSKENKIDDSKLEDISGASGISDLRDTGGSSGGSGEE